MQKASILMFTACEFILLQWPAVEFSLPFAFPSFFLPRGRVLVCYHSRLKRCSLSKLVRTQGQSLWPEAAFCLAILTHWEREIQVSLEFPDACQSLSHFFSSCTFLGVAALPPVLRKKTEVCWYSGLMTKSIAIAAVTQKAIVFVSGHTGVHVVIWTPTWTILLKNVIKMDSLIKQNVLSPRQGVAS